MDETKERKKVKVAYPYDKKTCLVGVKSINNREQRNNFTFALKHRIFDVKLSIRGRGEKKL